MNIVERVKAHFDSQEVKRIEVPEWADEEGNATILYCQPFTLADRKKLSRLAADDDLEFIARLVIMKAEDENGEKVFDLSHKPILMNKADPNVISRIAAQITASPSVEEQSGN